MATAVEAGRSVAIYLLYRKVRESDTEVAYAWADADQRFDAEVVIDKRTVRPPTEPSDRRACTVAVRVIGAARTTGEWPPSGVYQA